MKNKGTRLIVMLLLALSAALTGCGKISQISVTSLKIESIAPKGLRAVDADFQLGIDNPAFQISLSEIVCTVKHSGKVIGKLAVDPFVLQAKTESVYHLTGHASLDEKVSLRELMVLMDKTKLEECTVDASAWASRKGHKKGIPISIKDIPVKKLLENSANGNVK